MLKYKKKTSFDLLFRRVFSPPLSRDGLFILGFYFFSRREFERPPTRVYRPSPPPPFIAGLTCRGVSKSKVSRKNAERAPAYDKSRGPIRFSDFSV